MSIITAHQFEEALRDWLGGRVIFRDGWRTRDSNGDFSAHGHLHHWTAMRTNSGRVISPELQERVLAAGHAGLPGPLCHLSTRRSGLVVVIAGPHANANHAGSGDRNVWSEVFAGAFNGSPAANDDSVDGNERLYGYEHQFHPDDGEFPEEQFEAGVLATAALSEAHGWPADAAAGSTLDHYEWAARKWDREVQNLAHRTREGVREALTNPHLFREADMAFTEADRKMLEQNRAMLRRILNRHSKDGYLRKWRRKAADRWERLFRESE